VAKVVEAEDTATGSSTFVTVRICQIASAITIPARPSAHFLTSNQNAPRNIALPRVLPSVGEQQLRRWRA
jgi:hypothetical protein